jgi:hypothetical protein
MCSLLCIAGRLSPLPRWFTGGAFSCAGRIRGMEPNPYESPKTDQKQGKPNTARTYTTVTVLGCLMLPACFIAFFCTCVARVGIGVGIPNPSPVDELAPYVAAAIVAGVFVIAMFLNRNRG